MTNVLEPHPLSRQMEFLYRNNRSVWNSGNQRSCRFWVEKFGLEWNLGNERISFCWTPSRIRLMRRIWAETLWESSFLTKKCVKRLKFYTQLHNASLHPGTRSPTMQQLWLTVWCNVALPVMCFFVRIWESNRDNLWYVCCWDVWGKNLEWLAKASNWAKFSATASLGLILCVSMGEFLCGKTMENSQVWFIRATSRNPGTETWWNCELIVCSASLNAIDWVLQWEQVNLEHLFASTRRQLVLFHQVWNVWKVLN